MSSGLGLTSSQVVSLYVRSNLVEGVGVVPPAESTACERSGRQPLAPPPDTPTHTALALQETALQSCPM